MYAGIEALFLGPKDDDSHTILYFTLRRNLTKASEESTCPFQRRSEGKRPERKGKRQIERNVWPRAIRRARARLKQRLEAKVSKPAIEP